MTRIAITRFELGPRPPTIEGIKVFPSPSSPTHDEMTAGSARRGGGRGGGGEGRGQRGAPSQQSDAVVIEVDVDWAGSQGEEEFFFFFGGGGGAGGCFSGGYFSSSFFAALSVLFLFW